VATRLIVTGASGFIGRHFLDAVKERYEIVGIARRSQVRSGAPVHANITWFQVDIGDRPELSDVFARIGRTDDDVVVHLAAHYDFTGEAHPEYRRTNVEGLRNVLDLCRAMRPRRFLFSSSLAACGFPRPPARLDETSPPDGDHVYAESKRIGERMLDEYRDAFPSTVLRFAALFSDWCEYPPLFVFLDTWLSGAWNARVLGGRGRSAIPYLHVRDLVSFLRRAIARADEHRHGEVLIGSTDGAVSHEALFEVATRDWFGRPRRPIHMPRVLCGPGIRVRAVLGRALGEVPFERPWMARYIDESLTVDASHTRRRLGWAPRERLEIGRRLPFLLAHRRTDPLEWNRRNRAAMKEARIRPNLTIHRLLRKHEPEIAAHMTVALMGEKDGVPRFPAYRRVSVDEQRWNHRLVLRQLMNAVLSRQRSVFFDSCRDLAEQRARQGFTAEEVCAALQELNRIAVTTLSADPESREVRAELHDSITMNVRFGCDQIEDVFDEFAQRGRE